MTQTLFLGPEGEQCGGRTVEAERIEPAEIERTEHFVQQPSLCQRQIETEVAPWPWGDCQAGRRERRVRSR